MGSESKEVLQEHQDSIKLKQTIKSTEKAPTKVLKCKNLTLSEG
jgi:hypothetical protein